MRDIPPNTFKRRLADRTPQLGFWLSLNSLAGTEIAAGGGFDWLLLDMEHNLIDTSQVELHLLAARHASDVELVVRVPSVDPILIKRLLDGGIRSFMFPFVQTLAEARVAVASTRYPPAGIRGFSGMHRGNRFSRDATYPQRAHEEICVIIQIESPAAVEAIPEFGTVEGLDGLFIGPNDLAASMGLVGQTGHATVREKVSEALRLMLETDKAPGILDFNPANSGALLAEGFRFAAIGGDASSLARSFALMLEEVRRTAGGA